ncbi:uncharacterized protein LOC110855412 [Folsomia candida]|uniref:Uncharacterized protein n=1 Tax=Folsomia candida TaxID=158441 RepID=A0A226DU06_FOLCA|nr:uncharacterized protein LOC110855412 [Folsomia candida]OXA48201.1 hypothetical protein Fcan01_17015 [Folsomia candida]
MSKLYICFVVFSTMFVGFAVAGSLQFKNVSSRGLDWYAGNKPETRQVSSCLGGHCHSRNCCTYYCNAPTDTCLMITGKPFCMDEVMGPYNAMHCVESRCLDCPLSSGLHCSSILCEDLEGYPSMMMCDFSSIRGPAQP